MKKIFILLILLASLASAQVYDIGIFGTETAKTNLDTINTADSTLTSRVIYWKSWSAMDGSFTVYGYVKVLSGNGNTGYVIFNRLLDDSPEFLSPNPDTLGSYSVTDSTAFEFPVSSETAWTLCKGGMFTFQGDSSGDSLKFMVQYLAK